MGHKLAGRITKGTVLGTLIGGRGRKRMFSCLHGAGGEESPEVQCPGTWGRIGQGTPRMKGQEKGLPLGHQIIFGLISCFSEAASEAQGVK